MEPFREMNKNNIFLIVLLLVGTTAQGQMSDSSIRASIQYQISQRHPNIPQGFWEGLGSTAVPVIEKMYGESTSANEKGFLIDGLSHFRDPSAGAFLQSQASAIQDEVLKKKLVSAVIESEGERSFDFVEPYLKDKDPHVRLAVAKNLSEFDQNEKIQKRLAEFRASEKTPWVLAELNRLPSAEQLQKLRKLTDKNPSKKPGVSTQTTEVVETGAIPGKNLAGIWRGAYVTESKVILVEANLVVQDAVGQVPIKWKIELKLPKQVKQEWKNDELKLTYFKTNRAHWIEVRNPRLDIVFLAQKKMK